MKPNINKCFIYDLERENAVMVTEKEGQSFSVKEWEALFDWDCNNVEINPEIPGLAEHDFSLSPDSPIVELGFKPLPDSVTKRK